MTDRDRNAAGYAALLGALLDTRRDEATARFDAQLDAAVAGDRVDAATARALRWWQRASVRAVESYLTSMLPGLVALRDEADAHAAAEATAAASSWAQAGGLVATASAQPERPVRFRLVAQTDAVRAALAANGTDDKPDAVRPSSGVSNGGARARPATPA
jgi:hypothetical protein